MKLSTEPNRRQQQIKNRYAIGVPAALGTAIVTGGELLLTHPGVAIVSGGLIGIVGCLSGIVHSLDNRSARLTRRPLPGYEHAVDDMIALLVRISRNGLRPVDRPSAQNVLNRGAASLTHILGEEPWLASERADRRRFNIDPIPCGDGMHPGRIGQKLAAYKYLPSLGRSKKGHEINAAHAAMAECLPALVAIARAFDLDASGLSPTLGDLPGMASRRTKPLTDAASRVHLLAARWKSSADRNVDPLLAMEADAAAGRDLRDLESVWATARSEASPERIMEIDETYRRATDALERTLETALEASGDSAVDALTTHVTYITSKHALNAAS